MSTPIKFAAGSPKPKNVKTAPAQRTMLKDMAQLSSKATIWFVVKNLGPVISWTNGMGVLMSITIADETGEKRMTVFKDQATHLSTFLKVNQAYSATLARIDAKGPDVKLEDASVIANLPSGSVNIKAMPSAPLGFLNQLSKGEVDARVTISDMNPEWTYIGCLECKRSKTTCTCIDSEAAYFIRLSFKATDGMGNSVKAAAFEAAAKALLDIPDQVTGQDAFDLVESWMENPVPIKAVARFRTAVIKSVGYTTIVKVLKVGEVVEEDSHSEPELNSSGIDAEDGPSSDSDDAEVAEVDEIGETQLTKRKKVVIVSDNEDPEDHSAPALVQTPKSKKRDVSKKVALSTRVRTPKIKKEYQ